MKGGGIGLIDSGIGGLSVLKKAASAFPHEQFIYFGDNEKAPYGTRTTADLVSIAFENLKYISYFNPKLVIIACNTLSVTAISKMRPLFDFPLIGVYPPVLTCLKRGGKTLLLCTDKTAESYRGIKDLQAVGLSALVTQIEKKAGDTENIKISDYLPKNITCDNLILGCTHFLFAKNQIIDHLKPRFATSGGDFAIVKARKYAESVKTVVKNKQYNIMFIGDSADYNKFVWVNRGFLL